MATLVPTNGNPGAYKWRPWCLQMATFVPTKGDLGAYQWRPWCLPMAILVQRKASDPKALKP
eukprot:2890846-Amphidinium_carterae.1